MFPCIISFSRLSSFFLIICPKYVSFRFLIDSSSCLSVSAIHLFFSMSMTYVVAYRYLRHVISNALIFVSSYFLMVQLSHPFVATGLIKALSSFNFIVFAIPWFCHKYMALSCVVIAYPFASLDWLHLGLFCLRTCYALVNHSACVSKVVWLNEDLIGWLIDFNDFLIIPFDSFSSWTINLIILHLYSNWHLTLIFFF